MSKYLIPTLFQDLGAAAIDEDFGVVNVRYIQVKLEDSEVVKIEVLEERAFHMKTAVMELRRPLIGFVCFE